MVKRRSPEKTYVAIPFDPREPPIAFSGTDTPFRNYILCKYMPEDSVTEIGRQVKEINLPCEWLPFQLRIGNLPPWIKMTMRNGTITRIEQYKPIRPIDISGYESELQEEEGHE